jgi:hypothetical protein
VSLQPPEICHPSKIEVLQPHLPRPPSIKAIMYSCTPPRLLYSHHRSAILYGHGQCLALAPPSRRGAQSRAHSHTRQALPPPPLHHTLLSGCTAHGAPGPAQPPGRSITCATAHTAGSAPSTAPPHTAQRLYVLPTGRLPRPAAGALQSRAHSHTRQALPLHRSAIPAPWHACQGGARPCPVDHPHVHKQPHVHVISEETGRHAQTNDLDKSALSYSPNAKLTAAPANTTWPLGQAGLNSRDKGPQDGRLARAGQCGVRACPGTLPRPGHVA